MQTTNYIITALHWSIHFIFCSQINREWFYLLSEEMGMWKHLAVDSKSASTTILDKYKPEQFSLYPKSKSNLKACSKHPKHGFQQAKPHSRQLQSSLRSSQQSLSSQRPVSSTPQIRRSYHQPKNNCEQSKDSNQPNLSSQQLIPSEQPESGSEQFDSNSQHSMIGSQSTLDEQPEPYHQHILPVSQYSKSSSQQCKQTQQTKQPLQSPQHHSDHKLSPSSQYSIANAQQSDSKYPHHAFTLQQSEQSSQSPQPQQNTQHLNNIHYQRLSPGSHYPSSVTSEPTANAQQSEVSEQSSLSPQPQQNTQHLNRHYQQRLSPGSQYPSSVTSVSTSNTQQSEVSPPQVMPCLPTRKQVHFSTSPSQPIHKTSPTNSTHSEEDAMLVDKLRKVIMELDISSCDCYNITGYANSCDFCDAVKMINIYTGLSTIWTSIVKNDGHFRMPGFKITWSIACFISHNVLT